MEDGASALSRDAAGRCRGRATRRPCTAPAPPHLPAEKLTSLALMPAYSLLTSTAPGGSCAGSGRRTMRVAARKSEERRYTSTTRVAAVGRPGAAPPAVAQARSAGSTRAAAALEGISTAAACGAGEGG